MACVTPIAVLGFLFFTGLWQAFSQCHLQRGFTAAQMIPMDTNLTYGCAMTPEGTLENHIISSCTSASENNIIDVFLIRRNRNVKPVIRLFLLSFYAVNWRLRTDFPVTLFLVVTTARLPGQPSATVDVDDQKISLRNGIREASYYSGLTPNLQLRNAFTKGSQLEQMMSKKVVRSYTAVYSVAKVVLPLGVPRNGSRIDLYGFNESSLVSEAADFLMNSSSAAIFPDPVAITGRPDPWTIATNRSSDANSTESFVLPVSISSGVVGGLVILVASIIVGIAVRRSRKLLADDTTLHFNTESDLGSIVRQHLEELPVIRGNRLSVGNLLGEGHFGFVYEGRCSCTKADHDANEEHQAPVKEPLEVAIKSIRGHIDQQNFVGCLLECSSMHKHDHPNILRLVGVCIDHPAIEGPLIVLPYMKNGDIKSYLSKQLLDCVAKGEAPNSAVNKKDLMQYVMQICCGMHYLASRSVIHRDLAARNCMLSDKNVVKIADFGMARHMNEDDYYRQHANVPVPIKWMAPESVLQRVYSERSDVWSFGVTAWEIFSLGKAPYLDIPNAAVIEYLSNGERLQRPSTCPANWFDIIASCWAWQACHRDNFKTLFEKLTVT